MLCLGQGYLRLIFGWDSCKDSGEVSRKTFHIFISGFLKFSGEVI